MRRALEDVGLFEQLKLALPDLTEAEIRLQVRYSLAWRAHVTGEPYYCSYCGRPVNKAKGEVVVRARPDQLDRLRYRAVCQLCREGRSARSDAGWES